MTIVPPAIFRRQDGRMHPAGWAALTLLGGVSIVLIALVVA